MKALGKCLLSMWRVTLVLEWCEKAWQRLQVGPFSVVTMYCFKSSGDCTKPRIKETMKITYKIFIQGQFTRALAALFSVWPLVHVEGVVSPECSRTFSTSVRESVREVLALYMVPHIAERVVGELETNTAGRLARGWVPAHVKVEVFWLCDCTLNRSQVNLQLVNALF